MAFPIVPRRRSGATGFPTTLGLGELAVNTLAGELYVGGDAGVMLLNGPVAAGTVVTEQTANGTATSFTFAGFNGTANAGYIVSVGGIDQPPSKYSISNTNGGTITFVEAPLAGELVSVRAIVAGSGGGGSGDATSLQGRSIATTAPTAGQVLAWNATTSKWAPASLNGSVTFSGPGSYTWMVPAWVRWVQLDVIAGSGTSPNVTDGADGSPGVDGNIDLDGNLTLPTTGANGADGVSEPGVEGNSIQLVSDYIIPVVFAGGAAGTGGTAGLGGGGGGGGGFYDGFSTTYPGAPGGRGNGYYGGHGGAGATVAGHGAGGAAGGAGATAGSDGNTVGGGAGGIGSNNGGDGGSGGGTYGGGFNGGGGGGGDHNSGGGGGGGGFNTAANLPYGGAPGKGGKAVPGEPGQAGETFSGGFDLSANAGKLLEINIYNAAFAVSNTGTITITW